MTEHAVSLSPRNRRLTVALYGAAVVLYWMSLYLYMPTLPTYVESKSTNLAMVGVVLSQYCLWQSIAADWLGRRKPFIVVGFVLVGLVMGALADRMGIQLVWVSNRTSKNSL